jgi:alkaline phosphatase
MRPSARPVAIACLCLSIAACDRAGAERARPPAPPVRAKNVILFLADAGGLPTLNAASLLGHGAPQKLFVQSWPHVGLMETSAASEWVTDSAAGMTAIVTGRKTHSGVVSQGPDAVFGKKDGTPLKTLLEHAEERGLLTGVVSDTTIADATPAACYAHANDRAKYGEIFLQIFTPRFGDGVDLVLGPGRGEVFDAVKALGQDLESVSRRHGRPVHAALDDLAPDAPRGIVVTEGAIDLALASRIALRSLSRSRKGYFLMIESDVHTDDPEGGLRRLVAFDALIREIAGTVTADTLLLFTADHSFDFRVYAGGPQEPLLKGLPEWRRAHKASNVDGRIQLPFVRVDNDHTGEEVVAAAMGPGAERISGFFPNTAVFDVVMAAYGWSEAAPSLAP